MGIRTQFFYLLGLVTCLGLLSNLLCFIFSILKFIMITSCSACVATLLIWEFILKFLSMKFIISLRCFQWVFENTKDVFKFYHIQTNPYSSLEWTIRTVKLYHII